jgi:hypothetical protein
MTLAFRRSSRRLPLRGVSILEFLGCLSAMIGGVVLGSFYLGVDVKEMAYTALEHAHVVEPRRKSKDAAQPDAAATSIQEDQKAGSELAVSTTAPQGDDAAEPGESTTEAASEETATTSSPPDSGDTPEETAAPAAEAPQVGFFAREDLITPAQREVLTRAYWEALAQCMEAEVSQRVPAMDAEGNWQLFDYLTGRKDGHKKAADAIAQFDPRGVDDHVMQYSKTARSWHEDGAKLFGRAVDLLTDAPTAQLSGPFAQSWQSAATQHRMEARLLAEKQQAVQSYLAHAYEAPTPAPPAATSSESPQ